MIWNETVERMDREAMRRLQLERLQGLADRACSKIPFYRGAFDGKGVKPADIASLEDIAKLPFTVKDDLRDNYPFGLFAVPQTEIVEYHTSSGTTGKPVVGGYTRADVEMWGEVMARCLSMAGTGPDDIVQNGYGYGLFTGGLGVHYGANRIGSSVIPISGGNTKRQVMVMQDFNTSILCCTPSYSLYIAEVAAEMGVDFSKLPLRAGCFGAEPWSDRMRDEIEEKLGILALDIYGLTEIIGPGVGNECEHKCGLHINEDHFYPEVIDPATGEVLPYGEKGELVITTLSREATPLIRYRTRDITELIEPGDCACGRTTIRMKRLMGRTDDMLIIRGVNVFPSQIEEVLIRMEETEPHYQIMVDRVNNLDVVEVRVEVGESFFSDEIKGLEAAEKRIAAEIHSVLGVGVKVKLVEPKSIPRSEGKAKRVYDNREL